MTSPAHTTGAFPPGPPMRKGVVKTLSYYASFALDPIGFVRSRFDAYGDIYYAPNKSGGLFVLKHPDHLREVLTTRASSFSKEHSAADQLGRVLGGSGLLLSEGDDWKRQRRMVQPAFSPARMLSYGEVMLDEARRTADAWSLRVGEEIALDREMTTLTLRIVSRALFGHDVGEDDIRLIASAMNAFQRSLSSPDFLPSWMPAPNRRALARGLEDLDRIVYRLIDERRSSPAHDERTDLLQLLVLAVDEEDPRARTKLTPREVRDQLVTLFLAGHETTSQALTWAFACLAKTPDVEAKLHRELASSPSSTVSDVLEGHPYTEQVVSEAMRLYPPVYAMARRAIEDTVIGGYHVPRGSEVMLWVYMTHRDPRFFPDPERFDPERFSKENAASIPKFAYLPFGGGPRACIGRAFAMMEARILLATLAERFSLELAPGQRVEERPLITLTPKGGMRMRLRARKKRA